jgi:cell division protein FtsQ
VREFVAAQPWVESCQVRRVFPDRLKILVLERQPVALAKIESELYLTDRHGVILEAYGSRFGHLDLAVVRGLENSTQENVAAVNRDKMEVVMKVLEDLDSGESRLSEKISEIDVSNPGRVALVPQDHPIRVYLGDSNYRVRYQTYLSRLSMMHELTQKYGAMDSVDLSVEHRIIFHTKVGTESNVSLKEDPAQRKG